MKFILSTASIALLTYAGFCAIYALTWLLFLFAGTHEFGISLGWSLMVFAQAGVIGIPFVLLIGTPITALLINSGHNIARSLAVAFLPTLIFTLLGYFALERCSTSHRAREIILASLSAEEAKTLRSDEGLCPLGFLYTSEGRGTYSFAVDDPIHGVKILTDSN